MTKRIISFIGAAIILPLTIFSQERLPYQIPTPGAEAICKFGNVPISYYTGTPNISVPIHTFSIRGVELPISLDYDATGVRVNQLPSWTGENWTLCAGGCITRTINGYPDELIVAMPDVYMPLSFNYFQNYNVLPNELDNLTNSNLRTTFHEIDLEPDVFHFNFMGHCGTFFLGNDGQWKVRSDENFDVLFDVSDYINHLKTPFITQVPDQSSIEPAQPKVIEGFRLRDSEGNLYAFGFSDTAIEYTTDMVCTPNDSHAYWYATSWYLTQVNDKFGNLLYRLHYERGKFIAQLYQAYECNRIEKDQEIPWYFIIHANDHAFTGMTQTSYRNFPYNCQLDSPVYLTRISCVNGNYAEFTSAYNTPDPSCQYASVLSQFYYHLNCLAYGEDINEWPTVTMPAFWLQDTRPEVLAHQYNPTATNNANYLLSRTRGKGLRSISIGTTRTSQTFSRGVTLEYFNANQGRPHLRSVSFWHYKYNGAREYERSYDFTYDHYDQLPTDYLTAAVDHWGYYNGREYPTLPEFSDAEAYYNKRQPDAARCKIGMLTKVVYPTGGASCYEYEPNYYSSYRGLDRATIISANGQAGGVRIKKIIEYADSACQNLLYSRQFSYIDEHGLSTGQLRSLPVYNWPKWQMRIANAIFTFKTIRACSMVPLSNSGGVSCGYSNVKERVIHNSVNQFVNEYDYYNVEDDVPDFLMTNPLDPFTTVTPHKRWTECGFLAGHIKQEKHYIHANNADRLCESKTYTYAISGDSAVYHFVLASNLSSDSMDGYEKIFGSVYKIYYPKLFLAEEEDISYDATGAERYREIKSHERTHVYSLPLDSPYVHITSVSLEQRESRQTSRQTSVTEYDYSISSQEATARLRRNEFDLTVAAITRKLDSVVVGADSTAYKTIPINSELHAVPDYSLTYYPDTALPDTTMLYLEYTSTGRLTSYKKLGDVPVWLRWLCDDYYLGAVIMGNGTFPDTFADADLWSVDQMRTKVEQISLNNPSLHITAYVYDPLLGITAIFNPDGTVRRFSYNRAWQLSDIRDTSGRLLKHFEYNYNNK